MDKCPDCNGMLYQDMVHNCQQSQTRVRVPSPTHPNWYIPMFGLAAVVHASMTPWLNWQRQIDRSSSR